MIWFLLVVGVRFIITIDFFLEVALAFLLQHFLFLFV